MKLEQKGKMEEVPYDHGCCLLGHVTHIFQLTRAMFTNLHAPNDRRAKIIFDPFFPSTFGYNHACPSVNDTASSIKFCK